jgi:uncharacterized membrane protein
MKVLRFAVVGLAVMGVAVCANAVLRVAGIAPPSKLPPYPAWTVLHFATSAAFAVLLPFQLWPRLRARRPAVHRVMGRIGVGLGGAMAASGVAIAYLVPERPLSERILMGTLFLSYAGMLGLGLRAALARDIAAHRAWMTRMTATTLTPLVQRLIFPLFALPIGVDGLATFWQLFVSAAWIAWGLNLVVAEAWLQAGPKARLARA